MGIPVLIMGESGSGKSASMRNLEPDKVGIFNVAAKPLPFRKKFVTVNTENYEYIKSKLAANKLKTYVIDDSQYLMAFESFARAKETGYGKNVDLASNFKNLIQHVIKGTTDDTIVFFLHHTEITDDGRIKAKTLGKMLDNQLTVEGLFSIVLLCQKDDSGYHFITNSNGITTAKSPMDMFDAVIDNDLKMVEETIREYYELNKKGEKENEEC